MDSIKHHILKQSIKHLIFGLTSVDFYHSCTRLESGKWPGIWNLNNNY